MQITQFLLDTTVPILGINPTLSFVFNDHGTIKVYNQANEKNFFSMTNIAKVENIANNLPELCLCSM